MRTLVNPFETMKYFSIALAIPLLLAACTPQTTQPTPTPAKPIKTVLATQPNPEDEEEERPTLQLTLEATDPIELPTHIVYQEGTKIPLNGFKRSTFPGGKQMWETPYLNGLKHGPERKWYHNGNMYFEKNYFKGKLHGAVKEWDLSGKLEKHEHWLHGKLQRRLK